MNNKLIESALFYAAFGIWIAEEHGVMHETLAVTDSCRTHMRPQDLGPRVDDAQTDLIQITSLEVQKRIGKTLVLISMVVLIVQHALHPIDKFY